jgi:glycine cleavage system aminomethyltransferase T
MLPVALAVEGRPIEIEIRERRVEAEIVPAPFYRRKK